MSDTTTTDFTIRAVCVGDGHDWDVPRTTVFRGRNKREAYRAFWRVGWTIDLYSGRTLCKPCSEREVPHE